MCLPTIYTFQPFCPKSLFTWNKSNTALECTVLHTHWRVTIGIDWIIDAHQKGFSPPFYFLAFDAQLFFFTPCIRFARGGLTMMMVFFIHSFKKRKCRIFYFQMRTDERALEKKGGAIPRGLFLYFLKGKRRRGGRGSKRKRESWRQEGKHESLWWPFFNGRGGEC